MFTETLKELRKPVDPKIIKQRDGYRDKSGNSHPFDYVEWHEVANILDDKAPTWNHAVISMDNINGIVVCRVSITIDGVSREGIGTGTAETELGIKKAEHDALKRAAVKFGIARDLYRKESDVIERNGAPENRQYNNQPTGKPSEPIAKNLSDLLTAKQLGMIRALARDINADANILCQQLLKCKTDELSKKAASYFIQQFKDMVENGSGDLADIIYDATSETPKAAPKPPQQQAKNNNQGDNGRAASDAQIKAIENLAVRKGVNFHDVADRVTNGATTSIGDLTMKQASAAIEWLNTLS